MLWAKGGGKSLQVASSPSPLGPFRQVSSFDPSPFTQSGGSQSYSDGKHAYLLFSQKPTNRTTRELRVHRLRDDDWLALEPLALSHTIDTHREAPVPFYSHVARRYFVWSSHTSGWQPNPASLYSARCMPGPWAALGNPTGSNTTFDTQGSHVLPLERRSPATGAQRAIYVGDRYEPYINTSEGSQYIFLPMEISAEGGVTVFNVSAWSLDHWPTEATAHNVWTFGAASVDPQADSEACV